MRFLTADYLFPLSISPIKHGVLQISDKGEVIAVFKNRNDYIIEDSNKTNKKLIVRGVAIFGGGSVRNEKWYDNMGNWQ